MGVPKHRKNKSAVRIKRAHLALKTRKPILCSKCGGAIASHCVCPTCGYYKGRQIIKTKADVKLKREEKRKKQEQKEKERMQKLKNK